MFARHGVPSQVISDNGPPFQSNEFHRYMVAMGMQHTTYTPLWPQGNAEVEAFMKPLGKAIRTANVEGRPWRQELSKFLLTYRSTPHSTTKIPPAQLLYNREIRGKLPSLLRNSKVIDRHNEARQNDEQQKKQGRTYADARRRTHPSNISVGDTVLVKQKKGISFQPIFHLPRIQWFGSKNLKLSPRMARIISHAMLHSSKRLGGREESKEDEIVIHQKDETPRQQQQQQVVQPRRSTRNRVQTILFGHPINSSAIH